jgi:hypothetical protein
MKYIYDIILNFNERLYEFYEWKDNDDVEYIKRIPIFKVSNDVFSDLKSNKVLVTNEFIERVINEVDSILENKNIDLYVRRYLYIVVIGLFMKYGEQYERNHLM